MLTRQLQLNFCRSTLENVADEVINTQGGLVFQELNSTLNAWRTAWENRKFKDPQSDGKTFSADPLPFWHLGKLLIVLHLNTGGLEYHDQLRVPAIQSGDLQSKMMGQEKVSSWLKMLREDSGEDDCESLDNSEGSNSRVLLLMGPLC